MEDVQVTRQWKRDYSLNHMEFEVGVDNVQHNRHRLKDGVIRKHLLDGTAIETPLAVLYRSDVFPVMVVNMSGAVTEIGRVLNS